MTGDDSNADPSELVEHITQNYIEPMNENGVLSDEEALEAYLSMKAILTPDDFEGGDAIIAALVCGDEEVINQVTENINADVKA